MMCQDEHFDIFETTAIFKICEYPSAFEITLDKT